jgi:hypothetical protein
VEEMMTNVMTLLSLSSAVALMLAGHSVLLNDHPYRCNLETSALALEYPAFGCSVVEACGFEAVEVDC